MKTEVRLTRFKGQKFPSYDTFLSVDTDGNVSLLLSKVKIKNWFKLFQLKKDAMILHQKYSCKKPFEEFCINYPQIDWRVSITATSGNNNEFTIFCDYPINLYQFQEKICKFCNITSDSFTSHSDLDYCAKLLKNKILENEIIRAGIIVGENAVVLTNGKYLVSKYSGVRHLKFVIPPNHAEFLSFSYNKELEKQINIIWENTPEFMYGNYKSSEKGTPLFYPCDESESSHLLIKMETKMKDSYGGKYPITQNIYNEFNAPYIYIIVDNDIKIEYDEESI